MISDIGLTLNIIGTLLIAFSFGKFPKEFGGSTTSSVDNKEYHFSYLIHPLWFKIGIFVLIVGFLMQLDILEHVIEF